MTDPIKAKIIELVPEIGQHYCGSAYCGINPKCLEEGSRPITLADVLRAIEKREAPSSDGEIDYFVYGDIFHIGKYASLGRNGYYEKAFWNLTTDYDGQTAGVKEFIGKLLDVTPKHE